MSNEDNSNNKEFKYTLVEQKELCLITFIGYLSKRPAELFEECLEKIKKSECSYYIFNFRDVHFLGRTSHHFLVQMQKLIRIDKKSILKICGIMPKFKKELIESGIIRSGEISNNVREAIDELNKK